LPPDLERIVAEQVNPQKPTAAQGERRS
jgi:hypothetical protein